MVKNAAEMETVREHGEGTFNIACFMRKFSRKVKKYFPCFFVLKNMRVGPEMHSR